MVVERGEAGRDVKGVESPEDMPAVRRGLNCEYIRLDCWGRFE